MYFSEGATRTNNLTQEKTKSRVNVDEKIKIAVDLALTKLTNRVVSMDVYSWFLSEQSSLQASMRPWPWGRAYNCTIRVRANISLFPRPSYSIHSITFLLGDYNRRGVASFVRVIDLIFSFRRSVCSLSQEQKSQLFSLERLPLESPAIARAIDKDISCGKDGFFETTGTSCRVTTTILPLQARIPDWLLHKIIDHQLTLCTWIISFQEQQDSCRWEKQEMKIRIVLRGKKQLSSFWPS